MRTQCGHSLTVSAEVRVQSTEVRVWGTACRVESSGCRGDDVLRALGQSSVVETEDNTDSSQEAFDLAALRRKKLTGMSIIKQ